MVTAIITAAGQGKRMGQNSNKLFLPLNGRPLLEYTILAVVSAEAVGSLIVTAGAGQEQAVRDLLSGLSLDIPWSVVAGGQERQHSIANALQKVPASAKIVLVHDGARPLVSPLLIGEVIEAAGKHQAALTAVKVKDTIKEGLPGSFVARTLDRDNLWSVQTPQAFQADILRQAYRQAEKDDFLGTDDASLVERIGIKVKIVPGDYQNIKLTTSEDLALLESFLNGRRRESSPKSSSGFRAGIGYDVHQLTPGRKLILGGVEIAHTHGLEGHSDADVLLHAVKDALLGAAALGDIGRHFPDTDPRYKGASSLNLLEKVRDILSSSRFRVSNVDATIVAQKPKLAPYIPKMNQNIADALQISITNVNVKATTTEGLGFVGRKEGIAAYATVSLFLDI